MKTLISSVFIALIGVSFLSVSFAGDRAKACDALSANVAWCAQYY